MVQRCALHRHYCTRVPRCRNLNAWGDATRYVRWGWDRLLYHKFRNSLSYCMLLPPNPVKAYQCPPWADISCAPSSCQACAPSPRTVRDLAPPVQLAYVQCILTCGHTRNTPRGILHLCATLVRRIYRRNTCSSYYIPFSRFGRAP